MLFWILTGLAIWIVGAILFAASDGWFEYGFEDEGLFWASIFWWALVPLALPFVTYEFLHKKLKKAKERQKIRIATEEKIRVEAEKELEKIEEELENSFAKESRKAG